MCSTEAHSVDHDLVNGLEHLVGAPPSRSLDLGTEEAEPPQRRYLDFAKRSHHPARKSMLELSGNGRNRLWQAFFSARKNGATNLGSR